MKERFKVLRFTLPDGRKMLHVSKWTLWGKRKWVYLFEVKDELDFTTNKPIPWSEAIFRNRRP